MKSLALISPSTYKLASAAERSRCCNGCGGAGSWLAVPDRIWGLCVEEACNIHDWCYETGEPKELSDLFFLVNLLIICLRGSRWLFVFRALRCLLYYLAVVFFGMEYWHRRKEYKTWRRKHVR